VGEYTVFICEYTEVGCNIVFIKVLRVYEYTVLTIWVPKEKYQGGGEQHNLYSTKYY
jgi:hypothetical protein